MEMSGGKTTRESNLPLSQFCKSQFVIFIKYLEARYPAGFMNDKQQMMIMMAMWWCWLRRRGWRWRWWRKRWRWRWWRWRWWWWWLTPNWEAAGQAVTPSANRHQYNIVQTCTNTIMCKLAQIQYCANLHKYNKLQYCHVRYNILHYKLCNTIICKTTQIQYCTSVKSSTMKC